MTTNEALERMLDEEIKGVVAQAEAEGKKPRLAVRDYLAMRSLMLVNPTFNGDEEAERLGRIVEGRRADRTLFSSLGEKCAVKRCQDGVRARSLCQSHYNKWRRSPLEHEAFVELYSTQEACSFCWTSQQGLTYREQHPGMLFCEYCTPMIAAIDAHPFAKGGPLIAAMKRWIEKTRTPTIS